MKRLVVLCVLGLALTVVSCKPAEMNGQPGTGPSPDDRLTVEEASRIIGLPVPAPTYLPEGYEISSVKLETHGPPDMWDVTIAIGSSSAEPVTLEANWFSMGMKLPPEVERVTIGDNSAAVFRRTGHVELLWIDSASREMNLTGNEELAFEELVRIAESVTSPPSRVLETGLEPADDLLVLRGESQRLVIHLQNNSSKYLELSVSQDDDLPEGIGVRVHGDSLTLGPQESVDIPVDIDVAHRAPSPTWPHREASYVLSTDPPPPLSGATTSALRYHLRFSVSYSYSTWADTSVEGYANLSTRLTIDAPTVLPPGMVVLEEAEAAADFPVAMLLPQYLPEGISPPPTGYAVSPEEPHSITVFYSGFQVVLSPEPDVSFPPEDVVGERTKIRTKQVVIGEGRIDWWVYDIHFAVISGGVPMPELKLVAESMMLVGPYSGSWLGAGE
ncbi:MAG: hypothetical protein ISS55_10530 [Dehalococcoidales bacterium]|nr:hypothetical protein [Dehalococcoidales bacterium]